MISTSIGRTVSVLLVFSAIAYSKDYIKPQDPKINQPVQQIQPVQTSNQQPGVQPATPEANLSNSTSDSATRPSRVVAEKPSPSTNDGAFEVAAESYTATAYCLPGRTASGKPVSRGLIAADPRVLPLGTRVRLEAGSFSGEYVVADTGGAVKGRRIDIWTPTVREARQFGRRAVKLTVLSFGGRRPKSASVRPRRVNAESSSAQVTQPGQKQEK